MSRKIKLSLLVVQVVPECVLHVFNNKVKKNNISWLPSTKYEDFVCFLLTYFNLVLVYNNLILFIP